MNYLQIDSLKIAGAHETPDVIYEFDGADDINSHIKECQKRVDEIAAQLELLPIMETPENADNDLCELIKKHNDEKYNYSNLLLEQEDLSARISAMQIMLEAVE